MEIETIKTIQRLEEYVNNGEYQKVAIDLPLKDLLIKDENGITYLESVCKRKALLESSIIEEIKNNAYVLYLYIRANNKNFRFLSNFTNEDVFFEKVEGNITLIEYILKYRIVTPMGFFRYFKKHTEIVDYMIKYNQTLVGISNELLVKLFTEENGSFLADRYISHITLIDDWQSRIPTNLVVNYCAKKSNYYFLVNCDIKRFIYKLDSGKLLFEELLDHGVLDKFKYIKIDDINILNILINKKRMDLVSVTNIKPDLLCEKYDEKRTYLDLIIEEYKNNKKVKMSFFNFIFINTELQAFIILKYAQNGIIQKLPEIYISTLLEKKEDGSGKTYLESMIEEDRETTVSVIIPYCQDSRDIDNVVKLKELGIDYNTLIKTNVNIILDYVTTFNSMNDTKCDSKSEELLDELYNILISDGYSNKEVVNALIQAYRNAINNGYENALEEIKLLINIKKELPYNLLFVIDNKSYFDNHTGLVHIGSLAFATIHHETSHALHNILNFFSYPKNINEMINKVASSPGFENKIKDFVKLYQSIRKQALEKVHNLGIGDFYTGSRLEDIKARLSKNKEEQKDYYRDQYPDDVLDTIFDRSYTVEELVEQRKKIDESEIVEKVIKCEYSWINCISDILDAITGGDLNAGAYCDEDGKELHLPGHGIDYYLKEKRRFMEIIANLGTILKSDKREYALSILRNIVGDELVDTLINYYNQMLFNPEEKLFASSNIKNNI